MVYGAMSVTIRPRRWTTLRIAHYSADTIRPRHSRRPIRQSTAVLALLLNGLDVTADLIQV
jgi:hypothetical protein